MNPLLLNKIPCPLVLVLKSLWFRKSSSKVSISASVKGVTNFMIRGPFNFIKGLDYPLFKYYLVPERKPLKPFVYRHFSPIQRNEVCLKKINFRAFFIEFVRNGWLKIALNLYIFWILSILSY